MPSWVTPPAWTVGQDATAALMNDVATDISSFLFQACIFDEINGSTTGVGNSYTGVRAKMGTYNGAYGSEPLTITFAAAFPSSCQGVLILSRLFAWPVISASPVAATGFACRIQANGGSEASSGTTVQFFWVAFGA
jgi:hypothetical protein